MLKLFLTLPSDSASATARGFHRGPATVVLEEVGQTFIGAFNDHLRDPNPNVVDRRILKVPERLQGFYAEATAMASAISGTFRPWSNNCSKVLSQLEPRFVHLAHVGAGWAMARLGLFELHIQRRLDPMLAGLAHDGVGFHDAFFSRKNWQRGRKAAPPISKAYDQGLGRALWFRSGGDPKMVVQSLENFPRDRQSDLWAGVGLATCYAGGASVAGVDFLAEAAGSHLPQFRQGAAFAAAAFARAGHEVPHCIAAAGRITGRDWNDLPGLVEGLRHEVVAREGANLTGYQHWRERVASTLGGA